MILGKLGDTSLSDPKWVEKAVEKGRVQLYTVADPALRDLAAKGLDHLQARAPELAGVSHRTFVAVTARLSLGQVATARLEFLAERASYEDRMAALDAATDAAQNGMKQRAEDWEKVKDVALEFLKIAGQVALPILLAAL